MKKTFLILASALGLLACSCRTAPSVLRETFPVSSNGAALMTNFASPNEARFESDGIRIDVEYLDRARLLSLSKLNKPPTECDGIEPVMTAFLAIVSNSADRSLRLDAQAAVLNDGDSVLTALNYDRFKELYPGLQEASCAYGFLFDSSAFLSPPPRKLLRRKDAAPKTDLFRNGRLSPGQTGRIFLVFDRVSVLSPGFTLELPGLSLTNDLRPAFTIDADFRFIQRLRRIKED